jgi:hypothetical protein
MLGSFFVCLGADVVLLLVNLVAESILASAQASADIGVVVLGNLLVGLLGTSVHGALDGLGDVVGGVVDLVHDDGWLGFGWVWFG